MEEEKKKILLKNIVFDNLILDKEHIGKVVKNNEYNEIIGKYYYRWHKENNSKTLLNKYDRLSSCNSLWVLERYEEQKVQEFKETFLCKDKFCNNCKKIRQAARMGKFIPLLRPYKKNMFQLTLTIPNVRGEGLGDSINSLFKSLATLVEYLKGKKKIKGIDFTKFNYKGAIRSLEITFKNTGWYHPHLHVLIVLEDYIGILEYENAYSIDHLGKREKRLFSAEEILIQKIWYLLNNKIKVTKKAIEELEIGYSCRLDKFKEEDFIELFKYMSKGTSEDNTPMSYRQFKTLYNALLNKRQIQGYGCFFNLKDVEDSELDQEMIKELYQEYIEMLQEKEKPVEVSETPADIHKDETYTTFSRKRFTKQLKEVYRKDKE